MTDSNVVPFRGVQQATECTLQAHITEAAEQLRLAAPRITKVLIVTEVDGGVLAWVGPNVESVSYLSDFVKSLITESFRLQYDDGN